METFFFKLSIALLVEEIQRKSCLQYKDDEEKKKLHQIVNFIDTISAQLYTSNARCYNSLDPRLNPI